MSVVTAGDDFIPSNYINMAAVLFMWVVMPAFGAAAYVPAITLGETTEALLLVALELAVRLG